MKLGLDQTRWTLIKSNSNMKKKLDSAYNPIFFFFEIYHPTFSFIGKKTVSFFFLTPVYLINY